MVVDFFQTPAGVMPPKILGEVARADAAESPNASLFYPQIFADSPFFQSSETFAILLPDDSGNLEFNGLQDVFIRTVFPSQRVKESMAAVISLIRSLIALKRSS
jgi:hypothetical protein